MGKKYATVRLDRDVHDALVRWARKNLRYGESLSFGIQYLIDFHG
jgi:hypothetical protein